MRPLGSLVYFHCEGQPYISPGTLPCSVFSKFIHVATSISTLYCQIIYKAVTCHCRKTVTKDVMLMECVIHRMYGARLLQFKWYLLGISSRLVKRPVEWMRLLILLGVMRERESLWSEKPGWAWEAGYPPSRVLISGSKCNFWSAVEASLERKKKEAPVCSPFRSRNALPTPPAWSCVGRRRSL